MRIRINRALGAFRIESAIVSAEDTPVIGARMV
jgi:hypothetical protein